MTPCSPRYLPSAGFLFNFKLTVFLIFSLLLSWRLGKQKSIRCGRRSRGLWITKPGPGCAACSAALSQGPVSSETKGRSQVQVRSTWKKSKVFTVCTRKWEISSTCHQGSFESSLLIFFAFLKLQRSPYCSPATLLCWLPSDDILGPSLW